MPWAYPGAFKALFCLANSDNCATAWLHLLQVFRRQEEGRFSAINRPLIWMRYVGQLFKDSTEVCRKAGQASGDARPLSRVARNVPMRVIEYCE